ncbi:MAG: ABC1 kinase family protein, partial [Acidimicrobiales bacterium]
SATIDGIVTVAVPDKAFRGPFADGPPPAALEVKNPSLTGLRWSDVVRLAVVFVVLALSVLRAVTVGLVRRRRAPFEAACDGLVDGFITLGPTFVKVGQLMASSSALIPPALASASRRCLDAVPPFPTGEVHRVIEVDLGRPVHEVFATFDDTALSAASIGQVHACTLDDGRDAVVKVQRPNIAEAMGTDLRVGCRLAGWFERTPWGRRAGARDIIADLHAVTFQELNPALEALRQDEFRERLWVFGDNTMVTVPKIYWDHCGTRTICMERVHGIPMDRFEEIADRGMDGQLILRRGAKVWAESVMVHGPFHGDMHAGNMWALDDGRGCYLDFGIMGELTHEWKEVLKDLFYTCMFDRNFVRLAAVFRSIGAVPPDAGTDEELGAMLSMLIGNLLDDGFGNIDIAALVTQSMDIMKNFHATMPRELVLIAKQLLYVDRYTKTLAPDYSLTSDPFIVKNIFPAEARAKATEMGIDLDALN